MAGKITRPIKMQSGSVANKRDDYRKNKSPSAQMRRKKQKHLAIGLLCAAAVIGTFESIRNIVLALTGTLPENSIETLVMAALFCIPIIIALQIFSKLSKWKKKFNLLTIFIWIVLIMTVASTLFPVK